MKTFKTLLAVGSFIAMFMYVQSEENKVKHKSEYKKEYASKNDTVTSIKTRSSTYYKNELFINR